MKDSDWPSGKAAVDFYFIQDDGGMFKCTYQYEPYFCVSCTVSRCFPCSPSNVNGTPIDVGFMNHLPSQKKKKLAVY